jgi:hypothetical protein
MGHPSWALLHCHPEPSSQADVSLSWSEVELPGSSRAPVTTGVICVAGSCRCYFCHSNQDFYWKVQLQAMSGFDQLASLWAVAMAKAVAQSTLIIGACKARHICM